MTIDGKALWTLSYGMYIVTARAGGRANGQIANAVFQVTAEPPRIAAAINKDNLTHELIHAGGWYGLTVLAESTPMELIGAFGFHSGRELDKLAQTTFRDGAHCPLVTAHAISVSEARVIQEIDVGSHTLFIGEVAGAEVLSQAPALTYAGYHAKKGRAPKNAPTYQADETIKVDTAAAVASRRMQCSVCGYSYDPALGDASQGVEPGTPWEALPDDWVCPICGAGKDEFK
jgi:flavin reductase (DIM6/NTAB) family NADH-FMN oxidoreductase RutF